MQDCQARPIGRGHISHSTGEAFRGLHSSCKFVRVLTVTITSTRPVLSLFAPRRVPPVRPVISLALGLRPQLALAPKVYPPLVVAHLFSGLPPRRRGNSRHPHSSRCR